MRPSAVVVTRRRLAAAPEDVWNRLAFYEEVAGRPPLLLRLFLPVPIRTEGRKSAVGDEARCVYASGHLVKRITRVERGRSYSFAVVEQELEVGGGIRLLGGAYSLRGVPGGVTEVAVETRYASPRRPSWLWRRIEAAVCHALHRHLLAALEPGSEPVRAVAGDGARGST